MRVQLVKTKKNQKNFDVIVDGVKVGESKTSYLSTEQTFKMIEDSKNASVKK